MKVRRMLLPILVLTLLTTGLCRVDGQNQAVGVEKYSALEKEAVEFVLNYLDQHWTTYKDSMFTVREGYSVEGGWGAYHTIVQLNSVTYSLKSKEVTPADRMNNVEWEGEFFLFSKYYRNFLEEWSEWKDSSAKDFGYTGCYIIYAVKKNNKWSAQGGVGGGGGSSKNRKPKLSEIPGLNIKGRYDLVTYIKDEDSQKVISTEIGSKYKIGEYVVTIKAHSPEPDKQGLLVEVAGLEGIVEGWLFPGGKPQWYPDKNFALLYDFVID